MATFKTTVNLCRLQCEACSSLTSIPAFPRFAAKVLNHLETEFHTGRQSPYHSTWESMMRTFQLSVLVLALLMTMALASGYEQPSDELLSEKISEIIPSYWSVNAIKVTASINLGDAVEPRIKQRLEATVAPKNDLFVEEAVAIGSFGPFTPILRTMKAGTERTLYAVANSTYAAGQWAIELNLENDVDGLGKPADLFAKPTVVRRVWSRVTVLSTTAAPGGGAAYE